MAGAPRCWRELLLTCLVAAIARTADAKIPVETHHEVVTHPAREECVKVPLHTNKTCYKDVGKEVPYDCSKESEECTDHPVEVKRTCTKPAIKKEEYTCSKTVFEDSCVKVPVTKHEVCYKDKQEAYSCVKQDTERVCKLVELDVPSTCTKQVMKREPYDCSRNKCVKKQLQCQPRTESRASSCMRTEYKEVCDHVEAPTCQPHFVEEAYDCSYTDYETSCSRQTTKKRRVPPSKRGGRSRVPRKRSNMKGFGKSGGIKDAGRTIMKQPARMPVEGNKVVRNHEILVEDHWHDDAHHHIIDHHHYEPAWTIKPAMHNVGGVVHHDASVLHHGARHGGFLSGMNHGGIMTGAHGMWGSHEQMKAEMRDRMKAKKRGMKGGREAVVEGGRCEQIPVMRQKTCYRKVQKAQCTSVPARKCRAVPVQVESTCYKAVTIPCQPQIVEQCSTVPKTCYKSVPHTEAYTCTKKQASKKCSLEPVQRQETCYRTVPSSYDCSKTVYEEKCQKVPKVTEKTCYRDVETVEKYECTKTEYKQKCEKKVRKKTCYKKQNTKEAYECGVTEYKTECRHVTDPVMHHVESTPAVHTPFHIVEPTPVYPASLPVYPVKLGEHMTRKQEMMRGMMLDGHGRRGGHMARKRDAMKGGLYYGGDHAVIRHPVMSGHSLGGLTGHGSVMGGHFKGHVKHEVYGEVTHHHTHPDLAVPKGGLVSYSHAPARAEGIGKGGRRKRRNKKL